MKSYHQFCGVAKALDVLGGRWTLLLVRDLLLGPRRYADLLAAMPGITTNLLADRLKHLAAEGLVEKRSLPPPASGHAYALTDAGRGLEPIVLALGRFGATRMASGPATGDRLDPRWAMVSLKRRYRGSSRSWRVGLSIGEVAFDLAIGDAQLGVADGAPATADLRLGVATAPDLGRWLRGVASLADLEHEGVLSREGPARARDDFDRAFA